MNTAIAAVFAAILAAAPSSGPKKGGPSRPALKGCSWRKLTDAKIGLEAWVQDCDFGFRKIEMRFEKGALSERYSDGGGWEPLVEVFDLQPGESPEAGMRRLFAARTEKNLAGRCMLKPYTEGKNPAGARRYTFLPDAKFEKEIEAKGPPDGVPDPPCGDWGDAPDGIQYWESQPGSAGRKVLFVRVGQDEPLFDEQTLRILPR